MKIELLKKFFVNIFGGKIDYDIEEEEIDQLPSIIPQNHNNLNNLSGGQSCYSHITSNSHPYSSIYSPVYGSTSYYGSLEDGLDYIEYRKKELKKEFTEYPELLNSVLADLREEKIKKLKKKNNG